MSTSTLKDMLDLTISEINFKLSAKDNLINRASIIKIICNTLLEYKDKISYSVNHKNSKNSHTWPCIWKSAKYGAKKYFACEYLKAKDKLGKKFDHFTTCQTVLENISEKQYQQWVKEVRSIKNDAPTSDPQLHNSMGRKKRKSKNIIDAKTQFINKSTDDISDIDYLFSDKISEFDEYEQYRL